MFSFLLFVQQPRGQFQLHNENYNNFVCANNCTGLNLNAIQIALNT